MRIAFEHVSFCYDDDAERKRKRTSGKRGGDSAAHWALRDVSFALEGECILGIAGHTGSGKSTLIRHLNGLAHPTSGRVLMDGADLADDQAARMARGRVGIVFQYPEQQIFAATVYDEIAFGPRNLGCGKTEVEQRVRQSLEAVHLSYEDIGRKNPFKLSGGQTRRVALASILACRPDMLVLDEPTAGLDPATREELLRLIAELHDRGQGIVIVSHSMDDLAYLADRILVLDEGRVWGFGTPHEIFAHAAELEDIGLCSPAAQALAVRLRTQGFALAGDLYDEESLVRDIAVELGCDQANS